MKSNDESCVATCTPTVEIGQLSIVAGMNSTSDSFSGNEIVKTSSKTSNSPEDLKVSEGHDDCLPRVSGRDESVNKKIDTDDDAMKCNNLSNVASGESNGSVPPSSFQTVLNSQPSAAKKELLEASTEARDAIPPSVVASDIICGDPPATVLNSIQQNDDMEVEIQPIDENDDSEIVEQDVNLCDICGDAGREDLLAICSRCSDGAEHTYCMRKMLDKVPEGEWLCEECQTLDRVGNGREENIGRTDEKEKNNSGHTSSEYINNSDVEGEKTKGSTRISSKRHRDEDDAEVSSMVKKPALESKLGSPRPSISGKTAVLTREISLKSPDKGKLQAPETAPSNDTTESESSASDPRVHNFRGNFSKSNSLPKAKHVDQVVMQSQKSAKEPSSFPHKEGVVRPFGKSMSFKSNPGRSESKVKMLSPRLSLIQDIKKQRGPFQRQHSFRTERSSINSAVGASVSSTPRIDKKPAVSRGASSSPANHNETKAVQAEGKSAALSRSSSIAARKTSSGEFKRPSMHGNNTFGVSSASGFNNERKYNKTSLKEDPPCSLVTERSPLDANEGMPDGLPQQKDLTNSGEVMKDCSGTPNGPPPARPSRDEGGNIKAAIEAAVLRKPGLSWKNRASGQSDNSSMPSLGIEVASHQDPITKKKLSSDSAMPEKPTMSRNLTADSLKQQSFNFVKQSSLLPVESVSTGRKDCVHINSSLRNMLSNVPAAMPFFLKSVAVPENEYIWEGSFQICRSGKTFCSWDGIQAHLSTSVSPKVVEAVNKFENRIVLYEVPRLSTWPVHFQEHGVREDNIALFFFAKDLESYDKIYKVLLDNMMKNDLALKGNVNGVELLIFPSSQLPDTSQRWNMLFFLWGVFRGKKESFPQQMPESSNRIPATLNIPPPIVSLPENRCSFRPIEEDPNRNGNAALVPGVPASEELRQQLMLLRVDNRENCDTKTPDRVDHQPNSGSSPAVQSIDANQSQEIGGNFQKGDLSSSSSISPHHAVGGPMSSGIGGVLKEQRYTGEQHIMLDKQNHVNSSKVATKEGETPLRKGTTVDLNATWIFNDDECGLPPPSPVDAGASEIRRADVTTLPEKMNHHDSHQTLLGNRHLDLNEKAPDLELALGAAERKLPPWSLQAIQQPLDFAGSCSRVEQKQVNNFHSNRVPEQEVVNVDDEDDVASAALSLSLSFPFPSDNKEHRKTERERIGVSSSTFLFGNLRDKTS